MNWLIVDEIIKNALKEDIPSEDITTTPLVTENSLCSVNLISKEDGILAGAEVFARVFALLGDVDVSFNKKDGDTLKKGEIIAIIKGKTKNVLLGERVALNLLQRMCGIATLTNNFLISIFAILIKMFIYFVYTLFSPSYYVATI